MFIHCDFVWSFLRLIYKSTTIDLNLLDQSHIVKNLDQTTKYKTDPEHNCLGFHQSQAYFQYNNDFLVIPNLLSYL